MQNVCAAAIVAVAIAFLLLVARSARLRSRGAGGARAPAKGSGGRPEAGGELVAVIAAAVAAASGLEPGSFRISSIAPSALSCERSGFNTPVWGHVDRYKLGE
jgi:hypothetical protein